MSQFMIFADNMHEYLEIIQFILDVQQETSVKVISSRIVAHEKPVIEIECEESFFDELQFIGSYELIEII